MVRVEVGSDDEGDERERERERERELIRFFF